MTTFMRWKLMRDESYQWLRNVCETWQAWIVQVVFSSDMLPQ